VACARNTAKASSRNSCTTALVIILGEGVVLIQRAGAKWLSRPEILGLASILSYLPNESDAQTTTFTKRNYNLTSCLPRVNELHAIDTLAPLRAQSYQAFCEIPRDTG
jgi:hypothetical protein